jgi:hypothetical protein
MSEITRLITYDKTNAEKGASFYCEWFVATEDEKATYEQKFGDEATWAEESVNGNYPLVSKCKVESLIPHQKSAPYIIKVWASFDLLNFQFGGNDSWLDYSKMTYSLAPFNMNYDYFGIRFADKKDAGIGDDNVRVEGDALLNVSNSHSFIGDLVYKNATISDKGSPVVATYSPYAEKDPLTGINWSFMTDKEVVLRVEFYTAKNINDVLYKTYRKCNGNFPREMTPKVTTGKKWLCNNEDIEEVADKDGQTIVHIVRTFRYCFDEFYWNTALFSQWTNWV